MRSLRRWRAERRERKRRKEAERLEHISPEELEALRERPRLSLEQIRLLLLSEPPGRAGGKQLCRVDVALHLGKRDRALREPPVAPGHEGTQGVDDIAGSEFVDDRIRFLE